MMTEYLKSRKLRVFCICRNNIVTNCNEYAVCGISNHYVIQYKIELNNFILLS